MKNKKTVALLILCALSCILMCWRFKYVRANIYNEKACESSYISDAIMYSKKALKIDDSPLLWLNRGLLLSRADTLYMDSFINDDLEYIELDEPMNCFENAMNRSENDWLFKMNYALCLWMTDSINRTKSIDILEKAIDKHDVGCELMGVLGIMEEKEKNQEKALKQYSQLVIQRPSVVDSPFFLELKQRNPVLAETAVDSAVCYYSKMSEDNPVVMAKLGILMIEKGKQKEAQELLTRAVTEMPTLNRAWYYLGVLSEKSRQKQKSIELYKKSLKLDPGDILALRKVSMLDSNFKSRYELVLKNKKNEQAVALSERYSTVSVNEPYLLVGLADYFMPVN